MLSRTCYYPVRISAAMSRIINTGDTAAKRRNAAMRSCAEVIRLMATQSDWTDESKDMAAFIVHNLRVVNTTIEESAQAWDDKNYWKKAEGLREKWRWTRVYADKLEKLLLNRQWDLIPEILITLIPKFGHIKIAATSRDSDWWCGAYSSLINKKKDAHESA